MIVTLDPRRPLIGLSLLVALSASGAPASAPAAGIPLAQDDRLEDLGQYSPPWFAEMQDVELDGDRAYVFGVGGLAIFDLSDPAVPVELGRFEPAGHPYNRFYRGAVDGTLACAGGREDLLTILDVSDPASPWPLAIYGSPFFSYEGAAMRGGFIYACRHGDGLEIVDISDPTVPVRAASLGSLVNAWDIAVSGGAAYVADGLGGLAVIDVTDPFQPVHVTSIPASGAAVDVAIRGTIAAVCVGSAGLDLFDLSSPLAPVLVSTINTSGLAITAAIAGDVVHVADWDDVESFDISDPAAPTFRGGEDTPVRAMGLDARTDLVVVADWSRLRTYRPGPSQRGDIQVPVESIGFGFVPIGATVDTTITVGNTGNAPLTVTSVSDFGANFEVVTPGPFVIPAGDTAPLTIRFTHQTPGYEATIIRIDSDDTDEAQITFPITADDNPSLLDVGNPAPDWNLADTEFVVHRLSAQQGRVVVMAFFANW